MATSVKFLSFRPCTFGNLRPTPNVTEWEAIRACLEADTTPRLERTGDGWLALPRYTRERDAAH
jgi:hypothetical protein